MQAHTVDPIHDSTNSDHSCISEIPVSSSLSRESVLATVVTPAAIHTSPSSIARGICHLDRSLSAAKPTLLQSSMLARRQ